MGTLPLGPDPGHHLDLVVSLITSGPSGEAMAQRVTADPDQQELLHPNQYLMIQNPFADLAPPCSSSVVTTTTRIAQSLGCTVCIPLYPGNAW